MGGLRGHEKNCKTNDTMDEDDRRDEYTALNNTDIAQFLCISSNGCVIWQ